MLFRGKEALLENSAAFVLIAALFFVLLPLWFLCRWLRNTPKFFWHCPCCGYAPPLLRGMDDLKEADCLYSMEHLHIKYVKTKFCPLIIPSICPECKYKFFEIAGDFPTKGEWAKSADEAARAMTASFLGIVQLFGTKCPVVCISISASENNRGNENENFTYNSRLRRN